MIQAKLSSKYQLSIPKTIREDLHLRAGQQFTLVTRGNIIELIPVRTIQQARGMLSSRETVDSAEYRDRKDRKYYDID